MNQHKAEHQAPNGLDLLATSKIGGLKSGLLEKLLLPFLKDKIPQLIKVMDDSNSIIFLKPLNANHIGFFQHKKDELGNTTTELIFKI